MKQLFHIENSNNRNNPEVLSLRLGEKHGSFAITDKTGMELYQLAWCSTDNPVAAGWDEKELAEFFTAYPSLGNSFYEVRVAYDIPQGILVSSKACKEEDAGGLLALQGRNSGSATIITELIAEWQLYTVYAAPNGIQEWINNKFPNAWPGHQYSIEIKNINAADEAGSLLVDFRKDDFTLIAASGGRLLLAQTFDYSTPADVLYYLLKTCQQFGLSQQEIQLRLSGLIEKESSLYNELYQYFKHIEFREASWHAGNEYPAHFFTSLNDLATCAS